MDLEGLSERAFEPRGLTLTCKGMSSVNWECSDADFEFVFGSKVYRLHSVLAEFLSPKVAGVRKCDPLCSFYTFKDSELFSAFQSLVVSMRSGEDLRVEQSNFPVLLRLAQELENGDLLSSLVAMIKTDSLSLEEAILVLRAGIDFGNAFSDRFGDLRDFVASRFYKIDDKILENLDLETSQLLLSSPSLRIIDEDSLYDFVRSRSDKDLRFASLFEFVCFDYVSVDGIQNFASFVNENLLENLNSGIWRQICRRLVIETKSKRSNLHASLPEIQFVYDASQRLDGIIAHLTRECGGNVHDEGIVNVTASSNTEYAKNVADLGANSYFYSQDEQNSWICYDFKERRVIPTSYSVRTYFWTAVGGGPYAYHHLKSWVIEVSNDGTENSWTEIDRRANSEDLRSKHATVNFTVPHVPSEGFRFVRLRQTGKNHWNRCVLCLDSLEIFGTLFNAKLTETNLHQTEVIDDKLKKRVLQPLKQTREFAYDNTKKLDGVVAHLTRECGGNVHDEGIVNVTASSYTEYAKNVVDLGANSYFYSKNEQNSWICYDFKERRVIPTSYSVRAYSWAPYGLSLNYGYYPRSWVIEVSNDRSSWTEIDRRENNGDLQYEYEAANFNISRVPSDSFRFFRLRHIGTTHSSGRALILSALEVFGTLFEK